MKRFWMLLCTVILLTLVLAVPAMAARSISKAVFLISMAVTDADGDTVLLISVDACTVTATHSNKVRLNISRATGIPVENISIAAAHQHSTPEIATIYYTDAQGNYTDAEGNPVDKANAVIKTDYASTFHAGVLAAAKAAVAAQAPVVSMETSTIGTKGKGANGADFNFVRNIVITDKRGNFVGTHTDNHRDVDESDWKGYLTTYNAAYESNVDHTMQLLKFTMEGGKTLIFANFQTHPHLGANPNTPRVHADLVGVFRDELSELTGADVIYFSGASGDVNPRDTHMDGNGYAKEDLWEYLDYGEDLAALAGSAVYTPVQTAADTWDVAVAGSTHALQIRDDLEGMAQEDADALLLRAQEIKTNGYAGANGKTAWQTYVQPYAMGQRLYSSYHASALLKREAEFEKGNTSWNVNISVFSLGPVAVVNAPYEMFQVNGQQIKGISVAADGTVTNTGRDDGFEMVMVASKANGSDGYIPSAVGYANGGYAADVSWFEAGTGEYLVEQYQLLLKQLSE